MDPENRFGIDLEAEREIYNIHRNLISSKPSASLGLVEGTATVEQTGPPTPHSGQLGNFGVVAKGIYRSQFPHPMNLEHLQTLGLKTILCVKISRSYKERETDVDAVRLSMSHTRPRAFNLSSRTVSNI